MLLVIAIIAILAGIVIIAINPGRQLAQARNAQRSSDLRALHSAVQQYYIDNKSWPTTTMPSELTEICDEDGEPSATCLNLNALVPTYLPTIPKDPQAEIGTNYQIAINPNSQTPELTAPSSTEYELDPVQVGTTTLTAEGEESGPTFPTDGLVSYWSMDSVSGTTVFDTLGSNDGTAVGSPLFDEAYGKHLDGVNLNGSSQYINMGTNNSLDVENGSISFWINLNEHSSSDQRPVSKESSGPSLGDGSFYIDDTTDKIIMSMSDGLSSYNIFSDNTFPEGQWVYVVGTFGSSGMKMYIDSELQLDTNLYTGGWTKSDNVLLVGLNMIDSSQYFNGHIDEVAIWNRALDPEEIQSIHQNSLYYDGE